MIASHLNNHIIRNLSTSNNFNKCTCGTSCIPQHKHIILKLNLGMKSGYTLIQYQDLIGTMPSNFSSFLLNREKRSLWPITLLNNELKLFFFLFLRLWHNAILFNFHFLVIWLIIVLLINMIGRNVLVIYSVRRVLHLYGFVFVVVLFVVGNVIVGKIFNQVRWYAGWNECLWNAFIRRTF